MDSFIQVDKNEWEAFLEDFSQFEEKYRLLLSALDDAESRLQALKKPTDQVEASEALQQASMERTVERTAEETSGSFLSRLKTKLESLGNPPTMAGGQQSIASPPRGQPACSRCGFKITRATRFCPRCNADFGRVVCSCGRELASGDRFCDHCGLGV